MTLCGRRDVEIQELTVLMELSAAVGRGGGKVGEVVGG